MPSRPCAGSPAAAASITCWNAPARPMRSTTPPACSAAFPHEPVLVDVAHLVRNNIYVYGIRGEGRSATHRAAALIAQKRFDARKIHTHTFALEDLPTALK